MSSTLHILSTGKYKHHMKGQQYQQNDIVYMYLVLAPQGHILLQDVSGAKCKKCQFKLKREGR